MLSFLSFIVWDPVAEVVPGWSIPRWYGLLFALGFLVSQQLLIYIFKKEGKSEKDVEMLTIYIVVATIVGARLGHVIFYGAGHYFSNPIEIFKIWEGGLASHGGAIGILFALYLYVKKKKDQTYLWAVDRLVIAVAITGCLIRLGNFMNSEILGLATQSNFGVVFARGLEEGLENSYAEIENVEASKGSDSEVPEGLVPIVYEITFAKGKLQEKQLRQLLESNVKNTMVRYSSREQPNISEPANEPLRYELTQKNGNYIAKIQTNGIARHPAQLYESIYCFLLFILLFAIWHRMKEKTPEGLIFGLFLVILWTLRFIDEYFKENQEAFEDSLPLNMGQILSIPLVLLGIFILIRTWHTQNKKKAAADNV
ncbi:prolipoprotein diacylglyceryl transferase [Fulvivirgaceae bacterium BMA12]|uniref:Phosphatidylglycerol--prolipoprotein diacylglyceryl transferase n=1 Tax=Agaribacillus aureus TaxID=3051825 RepID=A0ABT8L2M1_9BACT|nr:prolipoprotein diacylglyceryl transferase [Fulvivirgaceae bacterium BMA12]